MPRLSPAMFDTASGGANRRDRRRPARSHQLEPSCSPMLASKAAESSRSTPGRTPVPWKTGSSIRGRCVWSWRASASRRASCTISFIERPRSAASRLTVACRSSSNSIVVRMHRSVAAMHINVKCRSHPSRPFFHPDGRSSGAAGSSAKLSTLQSAPHAIIDALAPSTGRSIGKLRCSKHVTGAWGARSTRCRTDRCGRRALAASNQS